MGQSLGSVAKSLCNLLEVKLVIIMLNGKLINELQIFATEPFLESRSCLLNSKDN
jgi:hypothetical protein